MKELASIIIPVYNVELYLKECIDSLLNQTYKNIEILIVDDGSTDNSGKICDSCCRDPRVTVFHQSNAGVSVARNFALDQANGEYVFFVDPDDFVEPDFISCSIASLEEKNADLVIFSHTELFENSIKKIVPTKSLGLNTLEIKKKIISDDIENFLWNKAYRKQLWKNIRMPQCRFEDLAIVPFVVNRAVNIASLKEPLYNYRIHRTSYMNSRRYNPERDYQKINVFKSLLPLAKTFDDPQVTTNLHARILDDSIELTILNYYLNKLTQDEALSLKAYVEKDWNKDVLQRLGNKVSFMRWLIINAPALARRFGKYRYQRKCSIDKKQFSISSAIHTVSNTSATYKRNG